MIKRLKNLWELGEYHPVVEDGKVVLETDAKPKGMVQIINMQEEDVFKQFDDDQTN